MLRRFERIPYLIPGALYTHQFTLNSEDVSFINRSLRTAIESGTFTVSVGDQYSQFALQISSPSQ